MYDTLPPGEVWRRFVLHIFLSAGWIFRVMGIPVAAALPAAEYLRITAVGIPFLSAYNFYSAVAKAGGDARTPVRDMSVSCLMNMVLDYVFVVIIRLGIRGVASATVISQAAAAGLAVIWAASISFP